MLRVMFQKDSFAVGEDLLGKAPDVPGAFRIIGKALGHPVDPASIAGAIPSCGAVQSVRAEEIGFGALFLIKQA